MLLVTILHVWMAMVQPALVAFLARHHHFAYIPRFKLLSADSGDQNLFEFNDTQIYYHNMADTIYTGYMSVSTSNPKTELDRHDTMNLQTPTTNDISRAYNSSVVVNLETHENNALKTVDLSEKTIKIFGKKLSEYLASETVNLGTDLKTLYALAALQVTKKAKTSDDALISIYLLLEEYFETISLQDDLKKSEETILLAGHFMAFHRDLKGVAELMTRSAIENMISSIRKSIFNPRAIIPLCKVYPFTSAAIFLFLYSISQPVRLVCYCARKVVSKLCIMLIRLPFVIVFASLIAQDYEKFEQARVLLSAHTDTQEFRDRIREEILLEAGIVPYRLQKKQEEERANDSIESYLTGNEEVSDSGNSCPDHIPELDFSEMSEMSLDPDTMRPKKRYEIDIDDFLRKIHERRWKQIEKLALEELRKRRERKALRRAEKAKMIEANSDSEDDRSTCKDPIPDAGQKIDDISQSLAKVDFQAISLSKLSEEFTSMEFVGTSTPVKQSPRRLKTTEQISPSSSSKLCQPSTSTAKDIDRNNRKRLPPVPAILVSDADVMDTPKLPDVPERINVAHQTTVEEMSSDMEMSSRGLLKHRDIRFRLNEIFRLQENDVNPEESSEGRDKRGSTISQSSRSMDIEKDEVHHWQATVPVDNKVKEIASTACEGDSAKASPSSNPSTLPVIGTGALNEIQEICSPSVGVKLSDSLSSTKASVGSPVASSNEPSSTLKVSLNLQPDGPRENEECTAYTLCSCLKTRIPTDQHTLVEKLIHVFLENCARPKDEAQTPSNSVERLPQVSPSAGNGRHALSSVTERLKRADKGLNVFMRRINRKNAFQTLKKNLRDVDKALKRDLYTVAVKPEPIQVTEGQEPPESDNQMEVRSARQAPPTETQERASSEQNHSTPLAVADTARSEPGDGPRLIVTSDARHVAGYCMPFPLDSMTNSKGRNDDLIVKLRLGDRVEELHTTDRILETIVPVDEIERKREDYREYISGTLMWQQSIAYNCELGLEADYSEVYDVGEILLVRTWLLTWNSEEDVTNGVLPTWSVEHMGELPSPFRRRRKTVDKGKKPMTSPVDVLPASA